MPGFFNALPKPSNQWSSDQLKIWLNDQAISFQKIISGSLQSGQSIQSATQPGWILSGDGTYDLAGETLADYLALDDPGSTGNDNDRTFTNTGFLDLDALTGGAGSMGAVATTLTTGTRAIVCVACAAMTNSGGITLLSCRVSGATTVAASDNNALRIASTTQAGGTHLMMYGLTAGSNSFELQARVTAGTGRIISPRIVVIPL